VRTDEVHHEDSGEESGGRTGPRHAAPRKPLFTRLQMPAGKAIALAAMPTAVLMGMGLTPTLAQAKSMPKNPFTDGPCVTKADESPSDSASPSPSATHKDAKDKADADKASPSASPKPSASASASPKPSASPKASSSPSPSASSGGTSGGLLGGLGGALGGLLTGGQTSSAATPSPTPSASQSSGSAVDKVTGAVGDTVDKVTGTTKDVGDTVGKVTDKAKDATKPSPSASATGEGSQGAFPCVVEKKSSGKDETPPFPIPNQPWHLEASSLLLQGMHYEGVVNLRMPNGQTKQALKYTVKDGIDIGDLHQTLTGPGGKTYHVQAAKGSTSTIRDGTATLYTESLSGNLFGVIPITFDPEHPPPIDLPAAYFTHVNLTQAGQFGGTLTVPGLHNYITD
jgi:hypothetical protein